MIRRAAVTALALALPALLAPGAAPATAKELKPGGSYTEHHHGQKGRNWHVQFIVGAKNRRKLDLALLYSETCGETITVPEALFSPEGAVALSGKTEVPLEKGDKPGTWTLTAQVAQVWKITGTWQIEKPGCSTGVVPFAATLQPVHVHKDGTKHLHPAHSHGAGGYPKLTGMTPEQRKALESLHMRTMLSSKLLFPSYDVARGKDYALTLKKIAPPLPFHLRANRYNTDSRILDPSRPESLVYWWPRKGKPILIGFMYRVPIWRTPKLGKGILQWHSHFDERGNLGTSQMTHVWLTNDLRSAVAGCLPVKELQQAIPRFKWTKPTAVSGPEGEPC